MNNETINIWTDGACSGNPGPGGWAFLIDLNGETVEDAGSNPNTTNNQMELWAVMEALWEVKDGSTVVIHTDSKNVIGWLSLNWKRRVKETALICNSIDAVIASKELTVTFEYVAGHSGDVNNERVNVLAQGAVRR